MADSSWTLARMAELEERFAAIGNDIHPPELFELKPKSGQVTPTSSSSRFLRSRSNSRSRADESSSNSLHLSISGSSSRPTTPSRLRDDLRSCHSSASNRLDIHVKQIVEHVVVSLPPEDETPQKTFNFYQSTCNCEGFYTVYTAATDYLAYYATVNVITNDDMRRKQKAAKKAAAQRKKKNGFLSVAAGGEKGRDKSPSSSVRSTSGGAEEWSEIDLLIRNPNNAPTANVRLQMEDKFDRVHIDVPGLSPWTLLQNGIVDPTWEVAVNGFENGLVWKRAGSGKSAGAGKNGETNYGGRSGSRSGNLKLVHEATDETVAEFMAKKGSGFLGRLVVTGDGAEDEGWTGSIVASLLAVLEKLRRTRLEFETRVDPNWDFAAVKSTSPHIEVLSGKRCERCGIGSMPRR